MGNTISKQKQYWNARRQVKSAFANRKSKASDYGLYVEQYYAKSKRLRSHNVKLKNISTKLRVLTYQEFERKTKNGISIEKLVNKQFGIMSDESALALRQTIKAERGYKISWERAKSRQLSAEEWDVIKKYGLQLQKEGLNKKDAALEISSYFFGS